MSLATAALLLKPSSESPKHRLLARCNPVLFDRVTFGESKASLDSW